MWEWLGFYWGGRYHDYMHIEYLQSPEVARARIAELKGPVSVYPTLRLGDVNSSVEVLRSMLRLPAHNRFDQDTETAIRDFQTRNGLESDGVCGPMTWAALLADPPRSGDEDDMNDDQSRKLDDIHRELHTPRNFRHHHGNEEDIMYGHDLSVRKELAAVDARLARIETAIATLKR